MTDESLPPPREWCLRARTHVAQPILLSKVLYISLVQCTMVSIETSEPILQNSISSLQNHRRRGAAMDEVWTALSTHSAILNTCAEYSQSVDALNQDGFEAMFAAAGVMNETWGARLFVCMDGDNTGSLDPYELLEGLRSMSGASQRQEATAFAFAMLDPSGNKQVSAAELRDFVSDFGHQACVVVEAWVAHFEQFFGDVGAWRDDAALKRALLQHNVVTQEAVDKTIEALYS